MTTGGLIFMAVSWGVILGLSAVCMWRLAQADKDSRPGPT
jgi:hypothetical protein